MASLWLAACLLLSVTVCAFAAPSTVEGLVQSRDTSAPQPNLKIILVKKQANIRECKLTNLYSGVTNSEGKFVIKQVPDGEYLVFYTTNLTNSPPWRDKIINWENNSLNMALRAELGAEIYILNGTQVNLINGKLVPGFGFLGSKDLGLGVLVDGGEPYLFNKNEKSQPLKLTVQTSGFVSY